MNLFLCHIKDSCKITAESKKIVTAACIIPRVMPSNSPFVMTEKYLCIEFKFVVLNM